MEAWDKTPTARLRECIAAARENVGSKRIPLATANMVRGSLAAQLLAAREEIERLRRMVGR